MTLPMLFFITVVILVGAFIAVTTLRWPKRKWWIILSVSLILFTFWTFDPMVWRVHHRFPNAEITDCFDEGFFVPAIFHSIYPSQPTDLYGGYLDIRLANQTVDLDNFRDVPFFLLILKHCKIVGKVITGETIFTGNRGMHEDIWFFKCTAQELQGYSSCHIRN